MGQYLNDNQGNLVAPHPNMMQPIVGATGQTFTNADVTNHTATVTAGQLYAFTALKTGGFKLSVTGTAASAANVEWACPLYQTITIKIPASITTLNYAGDTNDAVGILREVVDSL